MWNPEDLEANLHLFLECNIVYFQTFAVWLFTIFNSRWWTPSICRTPRNSGRNSSRRSSCGRCKINKTPSSFRRSLKICSKSNGGTIKVFYSLQVFLIYIKPDFILFDRFEEWSHGKVVIKIRAAKRPIANLTTLDDLSVAVTWQEVFTKTLSYLYFSKAYLAFCFFFNFTSIFHIIHPHNLFIWLSLQFLAWAF